MRLAALIAFLVAAVLGCKGASVSAHSNTPAQTATMGELRKNLPALGNVLAGAFGSQALRRQPTFDLVFRNAHRYREAAIGVLADAKVPEVERRVVLWMMQGLSVQDLTLFLGDCTRLYKAGLLDENMLGLVLAPGPGYEYKLVENYSNADIQGILGEIQGTANLSPEMRQGVAEIRSGVTAQHLRETRQGLGANAVPN